MKKYSIESDIKKENPKIIRNMLLKLIYIILALVIMWNLIKVIKTFMNPNENPSVFGIKTFCIISKSMEPEIQINDIVIIKEVEESEINRGDIITFIKNGETITHRVVNTENKEGKKYYTTQGDANNTRDFTEITFENIEGKYIGKIPKIGKILVVFKDKYVLGFALIILMTIYVIRQRNTRKRNRRHITRTEYEQEKNSR